ncbi:MAG: Colicin V production protein [Planctomycetes bacterium ADurb.Bin412]|nr:MAG: Colicin V production protein [Planctomycetes bacterium ADurb.Bin412]
MLAMLILIVITGIITYFQIFKQGIFSALIMAVLCVISAFAAFNYFEVLSSYLQNLGLGSYGPQAICLLGLFTVCLLVLRLLADQLIKGNMIFPLLIDRIGAGVFGLIAGLIITGMIAIGFQLLPLPPKILGFTRCPDVTNPQKESSLLPKGDNLAVGLIQIASQYGFAGRNNFGHTHPDFLREIHWNRLVLDPASRREAGAESLALKEAWLVEGKTWDIYKNEAIVPGAGETFVGVRVMVSGGDDKQRGAADADGKLRFTMGQFRLVGYDENLRSQAGLSRYPVAIAYPGGVTAEAFTLEKGRMVTSGNATLDLWFPWPSNLKKYPPRFVEFKRSAQASLPPVAKIETTKPYQENIWASSRKSESGGADLVRPEQAGNSLICKRITVVSSPETQPLEAMGIPSEQMLKQFQDKLVGKESIQEDPKGYRQAQILLPSRTDIKEYTAKNLLIPGGYTLVYLEVDFQDYQAAGSDVGLLPTLVDNYNREYVNTGFVLQGQLDKDTAMEFAYQASDEDGSLLSQKKLLEKPFPSKSLLQEKGGRIQKAFLFYLIPTDPVLGLLGCRTRTNRSGGGDFWALEYGMDVLTVTTAQ